MGSFPHLSSLVSRTWKLWGFGPGIRHNKLIARGPLSFTFLVFLLALALLLLSLVVVDRAYLSPSIFNLEHEIFPSSFFPSSLFFSQNRPFLSPGCNLFTGRWVYDETYPLYTNCPFVEQGFQCTENGRLDWHYRKWRWEPRDCSIPRFNARDMLMRMTGQRVAFVGDSMGRTQWESLVCLLMNAVTNKTSVLEMKGRKITKRTPYLAVRFAEFNVTVEYFRSPFLVLMGQPPRHSPRRVSTTLKLDMLEPVSWRWRTANVLVFNSGHWWTPSKTYQTGCYFQVGSTLKLGMKIEAAYRTAITTWVEWVRHQVNTSATHVFFRTFEPSHWEGSSWDRFSCPMDTGPYFNESHVRKYPQAQFIEEVWENLQPPAILLNITMLSAYRPDGHVFNWSIGGPPMDCSHWCLPGVPDTWNELLYSLLLLRGAGV